MNRTSSDRALRAANDSPKTVGGKVCCSTMSKYAYSYDREDYTGQYNTPEEAFADAVRKSEGLASPPTTIYIGQVTPGDPQVDDHAEQVIQSMNSRAHVDFGDAASRYLLNVTPQQRRQLDQALAGTIRLWLQENDLMPRFVRVHGVREYPVNTPSGMVRQGDNGQEVGELGVEEQM